MYLFSFIYVIYYTSNRLICIQRIKYLIKSQIHFRYLNWYNSSNPLKKQPKLFKLVSSKAQRLFKKFLEPRPEKRTSSLGDLGKFLDDRWMAKGINDKNGNGTH